MHQTQMEHFKLLREAFDEYLSHMCNTCLQPSDELLNYNFDFLEGRKWYLLAEIMIKCDLRELTNLLNRWGVLLRRWHAWSMVLKDKSQQDAWELRSEFVDSLVHECLLNPVSIRDAITAVSTKAFHQIRLSMDSSYSDSLEEDPGVPGEQQRFLTRSKKEKQLMKILTPWPESSDFLNALRQLNSEGYIEITGNYRNLQAHSIGPRFELGETHTVVRKLENATELKKLEDGGFMIVDNPKKVAVSYYFGGTSPLVLETVRLENIKEYKKAYLCYVSYNALLEAAVAKIGLSENAAE